MSDKNVRRVMRCLQYAFTLLDATEYYTPGLLGRRSYSSYIRMGTVMA